MKQRRAVAAILLGFLVSTAAASAAVTSEVFFGTLTASSDAADPIAVTCAGGDVRVNGADPDTGPALCAEVDSVSVSGGAGANTIDLDALAEGAFPSLVLVSANGDEGDDTLLGSPLSDEFDGGEDDDTIRGNAGKDVLDGGEGSDRVLGGADDDQLSAGLGNDTLDGQEGSDTYELDLTSNGGGRVADTGSTGIHVVSIVDCNDVRVEPTRISMGQARFTVPGIERYPCDYTLPPEYRPGRLRGPVCTRESSGSRSLAPREGELPGREGQARALNEEEGRRRCADAGRREAAPEGRQRGTHGEQGAPTLAATTANLRPSGA